MCTLEKRGSIFFLTLTGDDDHRFNPRVIGSILSALRQAKSEATRGSVLITTSQGKFFSNGFDLAWAQAAGSPSKSLERLSHMVSLFKPVVAELISLPMPTIAAVQGHAAAAGFLFALSHDYFLMRSDRGVLYMSEVDIGLSLPDYFVSTFRAKLGSVIALRDVLLRGEKVKAGDAVRLGILGGGSDRAWRKLGARKWKGDVYKEIRKSLYPELCETLGLGAEKVNSSL
ncbi:hypothetical protein K2173_001461 [Erythroxylum novogranatense]|uniref:Delta(3)-Delta(2)-enoyl-CoA isomerase n=1 Tax=Erythroxylum novogranatense TaxID=1862640 RepID=A0AAV8TAU4_9ROSI|nr:hypothetical protein K2173_001461 [Erythroxylum novogranatense]